MASGSRPSWRSRCPSRWPARPCASTSRASTRTAASRPSAPPVSFAWGEWLGDAEAVEQALVATPRPPHAHRQIEVDALAELAFELAPRGHPDRLDHPAARADQDPLLGLGLDPQERADDHEVV